ncbi:DUF7882 family protein [Naasia lichenicola]|uniref:DUF7882 family protein n=1 Tax=Naasia lichenicola TaxID=2565933 RepID=UPI0018EE5591|nr:ATP-dependent DNA ligase [Naasia lichenicola]
MGSLRYDGVVVHVDDRTLSHLQIVIVNKLRRNQSFLMSWKDSPEVGDGRSSIWLHPQMLLHFKFEGSKAPTINEEWLKTLAESADSSRGLIVTSELGGLRSLTFTEKGRAETTLTQTPTEPRQRHHEQGAPSNHH